MPQALRVKTATKVLYRPMPGAHLSKKDADRFGKRLDWLSRTGELTPKRVLEDAQDPRSPLHGYFEWNDRKAAVKYRITQARKLMSSIAVQIVGPKGEIMETRAFHNVVVPIFDGEKEMNVRVYKNSEIVFDTPFMKDQIVQQALRILEGWQDRYGRYKQLSGASFLVRRAIGALKEGKRKK